jgi:rhodanese-related sulfurtransferase
MYETWLPSDIKAKLAKKEQITLVDVRELSEWQQGHISGAKHIPLSELPVRKGELNKNQRNVMICQSGGRSSRACKYLSDEGYQVANMFGGMSQWSGETVY